MSEEPRRDNPVSPLPRVRRTIIYWIGGLLSLLVLSLQVGSSQRAGSAVLCGDQLDAARAAVLIPPITLDDRDLVPVRFLVRSLSSGGRVFLCPGDVFAFFVVLGTPLVPCGAALPSSSERFGCGDCRNVCASCRHCIASLISISRRLGLSVCSAARVQLS
jgi:hypothetical protein